ncbi:MAG: amino acid ABC transporter ATP-binding protein [Blastocatellia bacterium]|nr:amino acid ABC transporter ATP-binding protein [Blastocatellia bacterium]
MIQAKKLSVGFGENQVLYSISFSINQLSSTAIVGPGGSGKSTLLKMIEGSRATSDTLWKRGSLEVEHTSTSYLPQKSLLESETLFQILSAKCQPSTDIYSLLRSVWQPSTDIAELLLDQIEKPLSSLNRESRRLVEFTLTLLSPAQLLLLDEPDADLRDEYRDDVAKLLQKLHREKTIITVTHNIKFARKIADYIILLVDGKLIEASETEKFFTEPSRPRTRDFLRTGS